MPVFIRWYMRCSTVLSHCSDLLNLPTTPTYKVEPKSLRTENLYSTYIVDCKEASPFSKNTIIFTGCILYVCGLQRGEPLLKKYGYFHRMYYMCVDCKEASPFSKNIVIFTGCTICLWIAKRRAPSQKLRLFSQYVIYVYSICI